MAAMRRVPSLISVRGHMSGDMMGDRVTPQGEVRPLILSRPVLSKSPMALAGLPLKCENGGRHPATSVLSLVLTARE